MLLGDHACAVLQREHERSTGQVCEPIDRTGGDVRRVCSSDMIGALGSTMGMWPPRTNVGDMFSLLILSKGDKSLSLLRFPSDATGIMGDCPVCLYADLSEDSRAIIYFEDATTSGHDIF